MSARQRQTAITTAAAIALAVLLSLGHGGRVWASSDGRLSCSTDSSQPMATWRPPTLHGFHEFRQTVVLTLPQEISMIVVEVWGGGGGGGGASRGAGSDAGAGGGGGGSGAYSRSAFAIKPGSTYKLAVGQSGAGGAGQSSGDATPGEDGGDSYVCEGDTLLIVARSGSGGGPSLKFRGGLGGRGRTAELSQRTIASTLLRQGTDGGVGLSSLFDSWGSGGKGGHAIVGTIEPLATFGGDGGAGNLWQESGGDGLPGGPGTIIIAW